MHGAMAEACQITYSHECWRCTCWALGDSAVWRPFLCQGHSLSFHSSDLNKFGVTRAGGQQSIQISVLTLLQDNLTDGLEHGCPYYREGQSKFGNSPDSCPIPLVMMITTISIKSKCALSWLHGPVVWVNKRGGWGVTLAPTCGYHVFVYKPADTIYL